MIITCWYAVKFANPKMRSWLKGKYFDQILDDNL